MKANKSSLNDLRVPPALLARAFGIVPRHLQRLVKNGTLPAPMHGKYSIVETTLAFVRYAEAGRGQAASLAEAQRMLTMQQIEKMRVFNQEKAKTLIPASTVEQTLFSLGVTLKSTIEGMADRHAHRLCSDRPAVEANVILREIGTEILQAVSRWLEGTRCPELDEAAAVAREQVRAEGVFDADDDEDHQSIDAKVNSDGTEKTMGGSGNDSGDDSRTRNPKRAQARTTVSKTRTATAAARRPGKRR